MAKTYTLPTFNLASGTILVKFISSWESGSANTTNSYLLEMSPITEEIDIEAGANSNDTIDMEVYDADNLFINTFIPNLSTTNILNCEVYLNNVRIFRGFVEKDSVSIASKYTETDLGTSTVNIVSFSVLWSIALLKYKSIESLVSSVISNYSTDLLNYTGTSFLISIDKLISRIINQIDSIYYSGNITTNLILVSDDSSNSGQYNFINNGAKVVDGSPVGTSGYLKFSTGQSPPTLQYCVGCFYRGDENADADSITIDSKKGEQTPESSFFNLKDCFELLNELLASFRLVITFNYTNLTYSNGTVSVTDLVSGNSVSQSNLLESNKQLMNSGTADAFNFRMVGSTIEQKYSIVEIAQNSLSKSAICGVMDFIGYIPQYDENGAENTNMGLQLYYNTIKTQLVENINHLSIRSQYDNSGNNSSAYYMHSRYIAKNTQYFSDPRLQTSIDPYWTASNTTITFTSGGHTSVNGASGKISTSSLSSSTNYTNVYFMGEVNSLRENCLIVFFYKTSTSLTNGFTASAEIKNSSLTNIKITNQQNKFNNQYTTDSNRVKKFFYDSMSGGGWSMGTFYFEQEKPSSEISWVRIYVDSVDSNKSIEFSDFYCFAGWDSSAKFLLDDYYKNYSSGISSYTRKYVGVISAKPTDYLTIDGRNYYIKKIAKDLINNETEIEAINYLDL